MSIVLKNRVDASERSAEVLESELLRDHRIAILAFDVQDLARDVVDLFRRMNEDVERWQDQIALGTCPEFLNQEAEWDQLYRRLADLFERAHSLILTIESFGHRVDSKAEFTAAWRELRGIVSITLDEVRQGAEQINRGEFKSLGEVAGELWDRTLDGGTAQAGQAPAGG